MTSAKACSAKTTATNAPTILAMSIPVSANTFGLSTRAGQQAAMMATTTNAPPGNAIPVRARAVLPTAQTITLVPKTVVTRLPGATMQHIPMVPSADVFIGAETAAPGFVLVFASPVIVAAMDTAETANAAPKARAAEAVRVAPVVWAVVPAKRTGTTCDVGAFEVQP
jgi:hypothetical protein